LLKRFIQKETGSLPLNLRKNPSIVHYYNEIIRFWNKLNFVVKRNLKNSSTIGPDIMSKYLYATYRILWEKASDTTINKELKGMRKPFLNKIRSFSWKKALKNKSKNEKFSICKGIPSFMVNHLEPFMDHEFFSKNVKVMNGNYNNIEISVRMNNLFEDTTVKELFLKIKESFKLDKIDIHQDPNIPELFNVPIKYKNKITKSTWYKNGYLILQNKASVAVVQALSPLKEDIVYDMCAAPGLKTSLIAQYMENKGFILAGEFLIDRMNIMKNLVAHLKVLNCLIVNIDSIDPPFRFENYFDCILLDAPCTGSGALFANPELKWRQNISFLHQNTILQDKLLKSAIKLLKPKGILVYSTCSLYPDEGEFQILKYKDELEPLNLPDWFGESYEINGIRIPGTARLFPAQHHTEGFFIGKFKKK